MNTILRSMDELIGNTPLVAMQRMADARGNRLLFKLESQNPAGSVKDRPVQSMFTQARLRGEIQPNDVLIEATSGNTGIAMAMMAAIQGYRMKLVMPSNMSIERTRTMAAYGAEIIHVSPEEGMEGARDLAQHLADTKGYFRINQFSNEDNPLAHYTGTAPEINRQTSGNVTHFVSAMGTTGTIMGVSRYFREIKPSVRIVGVHPAAGESIPGIRKWPEEYVPSIYDSRAVDEVRIVSRREAIATADLMAKKEGIFCGMSSGGATRVALKIMSEQAENANAVIVVIVCDRGDRYVSQLD